MPPLLLGRYGRMPDRMATILSSLFWVYSRIRFYWTSFRCDAGGFTWRGELFLVCLCLPTPACSALRFVVAGATCIAVCLPALCAEGLVLGAVLVFAAIHRRVVYASTGVSRTITARPSTSAGRLAGRRHDDYAFRSSARATGGSD